MKKIPLVLLSLLLIAAPATQAQYDYITNNGTITITAYTGPSGSVVIPTNINGLTVTTLGTNSFAGTGVTVVTIPNTITNISDGAFSNCSSLFVLPGTHGNQSTGNSVQSIGNGAFYSCTELGGNLTMGNSLLTIGSNAFYACDFSSVIIPASVTSIGDYAFSAMFNLSTITIPASVTNLGNNPFSDCVFLYSISVNSNNPDYTNIGGVVFNLSQTMLIAYPPQTPGSSYSIPNTVTRIGGQAISSTTLASITIPDSVTSFGDQAFINNRNLTNATIPYSVTNIGLAPFQGCNSMTSISVDTNNSDYVSFNGVLFDQNQSILIEYPTGQFSGSYAIPDSVTNIADNAFAQCIFLGGVTIPTAITSIGNQAFLDCSDLLNITIPASVTNIGDSAFSACYQLTGIYFYGNAPASNSTVFAGESRPIAYYLPGTSGWGSTFAGIRTALWTPAILTTDGFFGVQSNQFGFNISWASNLTVVVQASTSLASPVWQPLSTNTLTKGVIYFSDPNWTNYPGRFYRISYP